MSEGKTPPPDRLDEMISSALGQWPELHRSKDENEAAAQRIESKLDGVAASRLGMSDARLFAAPLPPEAGEGPTSEGRIRVKSREEDRAQFQELANFAKLAGLAPPPSGVHRSAPPARNEDSGVIDLKALERQGAAAPMPAPEPVRAPPPPPPKPRVEAETKVAVAAPPSPPVAAIAAGEQQRPKSRGWMLGTLGGLAAVAAAVAIYAGVGRLRPDSSPVVAAAPTATQPPAPVATTAAAETSKTGNTVDPSSREVAQNNPTRSTAPSVPAPPPAAKPATTASALAQAPAAPTDTAPAATATATASPDDEALDQALRAAAGVTPSSAPNADPSQAVDPGEIPLRPSQGQAQAALTQALPSARACVGPDDGDSQVTVTFGPNGAAQRVSISGGAAGKPAESCIRAAMMRARVPPFTAASFSWSAIVRSN